MKAPAGQWPSSVDPPAAGHPLRRARGLNGARDDDIRSVAVNLVVGLAGQEGREKTACACDHGGPADRTLDFREGRDHRERIGKVELKPVVAFGREHAKDTYGSKCLDQIRWHTLLCFDLGRAGGNSGCERSDVSQDAFRGMECRCCPSKDRAVNDVVEIIMLLSPPRCAHLIHRPDLLVSSKRVSSFCDDRAELGEKKSVEHEHFCCSAPWRDDNSVTDAKTDEGTPRELRFVVEPPRCFPPDEKSTT